MYLKTIWNPGDIITTEKWNNIKNNLYLHYFYIIPTDLTSLEIIDPEYGAAQLFIPLSFNQLQEKIAEYGQEYCLLSLPFIYPNTNGEGSMYYSLEYISAQSQEMQFRSAIYNMHAFAAGTENDDIVVQFPYDTTSYLPNKD